MDLSLTSFLFPYLMPMIADRGSAVARVNMAIRAIVFGKLIIVNKAPLNREWPQILLIAPPLEGSTD